MLRLVRPQGRLGRREFLRIGALGGGACSLAGLLKTQAAASEVLRDKSVIFLFLHGGPTQVETFDPKMTAPTGICSVTGEIQTRIPGVTFGSSFPRLAERADRVSIVRSFTTGDANHDIKPIVCRDTASANLGAHYARVRGPNDALTGLPTTAALFPQAVRAESQPAQTGFGNFTSTGALGSAYAPFVAGGGDLWNDMQLQLPLAHLDDRRSLLSELDRVRWALDDSPAAGLDALRRQAYATILGGAAQAFDLSQEDPRTIERYDTAPLRSPEQISRHWNNYNFYVDNSQTLGKLLLLARRLCEAGCGFVTVTTNFVWDMHADVNNATIDEGMSYMGPPLDHALSAFLDDVRERGLSEKILLVCCGEMGRTPRVNGSGGRDHWGNLAPLLLSGGGLQMGQVIGQSTRDVAEPLTEPMRIPHLLATIMHTLFDVGQLRIRDGVPPEIVRTATAAEPIPGLL